MSSLSEKQPCTSHRIQQTKPAIIDELLKKYSSTVNLSLCQGAPFIGMPPEAQESVQHFLQDPATAKQMCEYGDVVGSEDLRRLWGNILGRGYNNQPKFPSDDLHSLDTLFPKHELMITAGANQGFVNIVLALCDSGDEVLLVLPYYFSHENALVMAGVVPRAVPVDVTTFLPNIEDIGDRITEKSKAVVIVNPGNPSGVVFPSSLLQKISTMCKKRNVWLILDEAYREFSYRDDDKTVFSPEPDEHIIKLYTMSKVYGLAGWRVGALLYPKRISADMRKVQDTIPTHASLLSQFVACEALKHSPFYEKDNYISMMRFVWVQFCEAVKKAYCAVSLSNYVLPCGAFYFFLPYDDTQYIAEKTEADDSFSVDFLATRFRILVCPGFSFGMCGYIRVSYGRIKPTQAKKASLHFGNAMSALLKEQSRRRETKSSSH
ncbi:Aspartate aminotransferase [Gracilariopsis chorda]|uniref:Aspartate aminotransferase n=1 Tax=Gracilariopsis chorda TaxID=448386 RepID=A0A2V3IU66_9FLOR|nr:Aspartate aminotransferase [Gracilariopsis chorda]|eukprot:PXF45664.1 Aspartate aminotransferase [Gracilariopsis chorda]